MSGAPGTEPLLEARGLSAGYGALAAVRDLDLHVSAGEVVALLGANGAGKTTTMLTLAGVLAPIQGEVRWRGEQVRRGLVELARDGLALVSEERSVTMDLTVGQNLRIGRGSVARALELFPELREHLRRRAGQLSGGQQQILALARALAGEPSVLLADELSLGLAPMVVDRLLGELRRVADDRGVGVLLVEQHVRLALAVADRAYVLQNGRVVIEGRAADLRGRIEEIEQRYLSEGLASATPVTATAPPTSPVISPVISSAPGSGSASPPRSASAGEARQK